MVVKKYRKASFKCILLFLIAMLLVSCSQEPEIPAVNQIPELPTDNQIPEFPAEQTRSIDGMVMVYIPAGSFAMGSTDEQIDWVLEQSWCVDCERIWFEHEQPAHNVTLDAYWIDKYEVSNVQFEKCVAAGECRQPNSSYYGNSELNIHPVTYVSWFYASAYCKWAGGSLPTEAQWEYAARGDDDRIFPWGNQPPTCNLANFRGCGGDTQPVTSNPDGASPFGVLNMAGNVWEWVADKLALYSSSSQINPSISPAGGNIRVLRGGAYHTHWDFVRVASRDGEVFPGPTTGPFGFRCAFSEQP